MISQALSWLAMWVYFSVAVVSIAAWHAAVRCSRPNGEMRRWISIAAFFIGAAMARYFGIEERLRARFRSNLIENKEYFNRWEFQAPAVALVFVGIFIAVFALFFLHPSRRESKGRRSRLQTAQWLGDLSVAAMSALIALRIVSLHSIDALLYRTFHLNWVIDMGASVLAIYAAWKYRQLLIGTKPR